MHYYQLSSRLYLEIFEEDAVLFIADRDLIVTINHAAAQIFTLASSAVLREKFSRSDCVDFLHLHYEISPKDAEQKMRSLLGFGLRTRLVEKLD